MYSYYVRCNAEECKHYDGDYGCNNNFDELHVAIDSGGDGYVECLDYEEIDEEE